MRPISEVYVQFKIKIKSEASARLLPYEIYMGVSYFGESSRGLRY
jgi:hypothetical protein